MADASNVVPVGHEPTALGYVLSNDQILATNSIDNTVSVINGSTSTVTKVIPVGVDPSAVAYSVGMNRAYIADAADNNITILSTFTNAPLTGTPQIRAGGGPRAMLIEGNDLCVVDSSDNNVTLYDVTNNQMVGRPIRVGLDPTALTYVPPINSLFVVNSGENTVSVIPLNGSVATEKIVVGHDPRAIAYSPVNNEVYVANEGDNDVMAIAPFGGHVLKTIPVGHSPDALIVPTTTSTVAYVANSVDDTVSLIYVLSDRVVNVLPVGEFPIAFGYDSQNKNLYVANYVDNTVSVLSTSTLILTCPQDTLAVGKSIRCTANVIGKSPSGSVTWTTSGSGRLIPSRCVLASGTCSVLYAPGSAGETDVLNASYAGNLRNPPSSGAFTLRINKAVSKTTVICVPAATRAGALRPAKCTATVVGYHPAGRVDWSQSVNGSLSFGSAQCFLAKGKCAVNMTGEAIGRVSVTAAYRGNGNNTASSKSALVTVLVGLPKLALSCGTGPWTHGTNATCTATLSSYATSAVGGTIRWSETTGISAFTIYSSTCTVSPAGSCSVVVHMIKHGGYYIKAQYVGDANDRAASRSLLLAIS